ncbi:MAG: hypothetical protein CVT97_01900 [Bacteroidetes bacterium HGW-Bacteroidetes-14]|jgi:hypothetical protein|nr:MAG: hypothetical protein CVT97_01900 [Bacteroidetes bacterium HGW-Bacteroidetes-14]
MKKFRFSLIAAALLAVASCGSESEIKQGDIKVIDLAAAVGGGKIVKMSEVADDIKYVPLETTDSSLIGMGAKVQIENGRIYVRSRNSNSTDVKVFDIDGKYLFTFNRTGRGPEEYSPMSKIEIDPVTGGFMVFDMMPLITNNSLSSWFFKMYDRDGNYLKNIDIPQIDAGKLVFVRRLNKNLFVSLVGSSSKEPVKINGAAFDSLSNIVFEIPLASIPEYASKESYVESIGIGKTTSEGKTYAAYPPSIRSFKDVVRFVNIYNDTIFTLDQNLNYFPSFVINYGNYANTSLDRSGITHIKGKHITLDLLSYMESNRFIMMNFFMRDYAHEPYDEYIQGKNGPVTIPRANCYGIFDKQTGFFNLLNQPVKGKLGLLDDIKNGPPFIPGHINADDYASALFSAVQLIEHAEVYEVKGDLKEIVSKLKDTDNPVVAIAKFK